jgi:hypothetical protein
LFQASEQIVTIADFDKASHAERSEKSRENEEGEVSEAR